MFLLLLKKYSVRFIKPFEYSGYAAVFAYYLLQFSRETILAEHNIGLDFRKFLLWIAIIYALAFLIFSPRLAMHWSGVFLACIIVIGLVYISQNIGSPELSNDLITLFQIYGSGVLYTSLLYAIAMLKEHFSEAEKRSKLMSSIANIDSLTGTYSRSKTSELLDSFIARSQTYGYPLSVVMLDIDKLKHVNDNFGHNIGDDVLRRMVELLQSNLRENDFLGRWGGDEFLLICPDADKKKIRSLTKRLELSISPEEFADFGNPSISAGASTYHPGDTPESLLKRADDKMYAQKKIKQRSALAKIKELTD